MLSSRSSQVEKSELQVQYISTLEQCFEWSSGLGSLAGSRYNDGNRGQDKNQEEVQSCESKSEALSFEGPSTERVHVGC